MKILLLKFHVILGRLSGQFLAFISTHPDPKEFKTMNNNYYLCKKAHFKVASTVGIQSWRPWIKLIFKCQLCQFFFFTPTFWWLILFGLYILQSMLWSYHWNWRKGIWIGKKKRAEDCKIARPKTTLILQELIKVIRLHCNIVHSHFVALHAKYM